MNMMTLLVATYSLSVGSAASAKQEIDKYPNGNTRSIVNYDNDGRKDGVTKYFYKDGQIEEESQWKAGKLDGVKKEWYSDGKPEYEGHFKDGYKEGLEKRWNSDGTPYMESMYKGNEYHGKVIRYSRGKKSEVSEYKFGKREGAKTEYHENGKVETVGVYKNDKRNGLYSEFYENGKPKRVVTYKDDNMLGVEKQYFENGKIKSEISYDGYRKNGVYVTYQENGKKIEKGNYKDNEKDGVFYEYSQNGLLSSLTTFKDGKRQGKSLEYFTDDAKPKKRKVQNYKDGKLDGKYFEFYANGKPLYKGMYKAGEKVGDWNFYLETGKLRTVEPYNSEGKLHGEKKLYHLNGKLQELTVYENGNYKSNKEFYENGTEISPKPGTLVTKETKTAKYVTNYFGIEDEIEVMMVRVGPKERNEFLVKIVGIDHELDGKVMIARSVPQGRSSSCLMVWDEKSKDSYCLFRTEDVVWSIKRMDMFLDNNKVSFLKAALFKKEQRKKTKISPSDLLAEYFKGVSKS